MDSISDSARLDKLFRADTELTCCQWIDNGFKFSYTDMFKLCNSGSLSYSTYLLNFFHELLDSTFSGYARQDQGVNTHLWDYLPLTRFDNNF
ncbi:hypothetical protein OUZ56_032220 [Daphnia magna]|uniref:Uncharacterized protein n=1 Tax=Daphnia magna TaxID=35525 RepID=A0ABQ9ZWU4_9CRUS|nr:hypothetical protein OUZ56_032220 [Daphnia magna]